MNRHTLVLVAARRTTLAAAPATALLAVLAGSLPAPAAAAAVQAAASLRTPPEPAGLALDRPLVAGFLIVDGVYNSELMAPYDVFHHTPPHTAPRPGIEVFTVSPDGRPVTSYEGLRITPHHGFSTAPPIDVLVVPSALHSMDSDLENEPLIAWVREVGRRARFVMSLCDGAFVLARAGLLDGVAATTFPADQDRFAQMFPRLDLRRGVGFVHDRHAITSVGGSRSYDPALYLVAHLYGDDAAERVGRGLLLPWPPRADPLPAIVPATP